MQNTRNKMKSNDYFSIYIKKLNENFIKIKLSAMTPLMMISYHLINVKTCIHYQGTVVTKLLATGRGVQIWGQFDPLPPPLRLLGFLNYYSRRVYLFLLKVQFAFTLLTPGFFYYSWPKISNMFDMWFIGHE